MVNPFAIVTAIKVALSGIGAVKKVHGVLSEPDTTRVSFVDRVRNFVTGADEPRPLRVSAPELSRLYRTNRVAAKADYEGRVALIGGEFSSVSETRGGYGITLRTGDAPSLVCQVAKRHGQSDAIARLRVGQSVTVLGVIRGKRRFANVLEVGYCSLKE